MTHSHVHEGNRISPRAGSPDHARRVLAAQEGLRAQLPGGPIGDLALEMLLFLYAEEADEGLPTSACCAAVSVPRTTALRWITALVAAGLMVQRPDAGDRRVTLLSLSETAREAIAGWLRAIDARGGDE